MLLISAFVLGLASNFHCIGMCGPIALAIPIKNDSSYTRISSILLYNFGRIFTYSLLGLLVGILGVGISFIGQQQLSIIIGSGIIIYAVLMVLQQKTTLLTVFLSARFIKLKSAMGSVLRRKTYDANLLLGLLNGLLPCGMVYIALAGALAAESYIESVGFMFFFGLGTLPIMVFLPWIATYLSPAIRSRLNKIIPYTLIIFGILLVLRGSNLGIPYISPEIAPQTTTQVGYDVNCH